VTYIFLLFIIICIASFSDVVKSDKSTKIIFVFGCSIVMSFMISLRNDVSDFSEYVDMFNDTPYLNEFSLTNIKNIHGEFGYLFLNSIIKTLGFGERFFFWVVGFLSVSLTLHYYIKKSPYFIISLLIYFSHTFLLRDMIQIRSGLAASVSLYGIKYIEERKLWKFSSIIIIAGLIHSAALILFFAYFIHGFINEKSKRQFFMIGFSLILGLVFTQPILEIIFKSLIPNSSIVINYLVNTQYFRSLGLLNPVLIKNILLAVLMIKYTDKYKNKIPYYSSICTLSILSVFWLAAFNNFSIIAARLATFFSIAEPIIIAVLLSGLKKYNKLLMWLVIILYSIIMILEKKDEFGNITFGL
jgi:hypothetical protein